MPTYGYECKSCGYTFDAFQSMRDEALKTCPKCGKAIHRLISGGNGIIFKGKGFYVTDNNAHSDTSKSSDARGEASKEAPEKTGAAPAESTKAEASPCASCPVNTGSGAKPDSIACPNKAAS